MSSSTAELTFIISAKNLAQVEFDKVKAGLKGVATTAGVVAADVAKAFQGVGRRISRQLGNLATDILAGGSIENSLLLLGATMAGAIVEGLGTHLIPAILGRIAATSFFAPIMATFTTAGVTAGTVFDAAVAVTMAALPFVILAAAVAALVYLIANPEARQKAREVALMILGQIGDGLRVLGKLLFDRFQAGFGVAVEAVKKGVAQVVAFILDIPRLAQALVYSMPALIRQALMAVLNVAKGIVGKIVDVLLAIPRAVGAALQALSLLPSTKDMVDPKDLPGHASGGWVGLHGPELGLLGERGPEYIVPNHQLGSMNAKPVSGVTIAGISEDELFRMIDRKMYFKLQRAAPTVLRT